MIVAHRQDHTITRNTSFFKIVNEHVCDNLSDDDSDYQTISIENRGTPEVSANDGESTAETVLRRSTRESVTPIRYPTGVTM